MYKILQRSLYPEKSVILLKVKVYKGRMLL